jgi:hypothetical protein
MLLRPAAEVFVIVAGLVVRSIVSVSVRPLMRTVPVSLSTVDPESGSTVRACSIVCFRPPDSVSSNDTTGACIPNRWSPFSVSVVFVPSG